MKNNRQPCAQKRMSGCGGVWSGLDAVVLQTCTVPNGGQQTTTSKSGLHLIADGLHDDYFLWFFVQTDETRSVTRLSSPETVVSPQWPFANPPRPLPDKSETFRSQFCFFAAVLSFRNCFNLLLPYFPVWVSFTLILGHLRCPRI